MKAHLSVTDNDELFAQLETGERILTNDTHKLAEQLRLAGVTPESLTVTCWKTDPDHAPTSGQIIAVKAALRGLPPKTAEQVDALFKRHHETLKALAEAKREDNITIPTTGLKEYVVELARRYGVTYVETPHDELADVITRLSGDEVTTDATEDLIVELKRANVIDGPTMVSLLGNYLDEQHHETLKALADSDTERKL